MFYWIYKIPRYANEHNQNCDKAKSHNSCLWLFSECISNQHLYPALFYWNGVVARWNKNRCLCMVYNMNWVAILVWAVLFWLSVFGRNTDESAHISERKLNANKAWYPQFRCLVRSDCCGFDVFCQLTISKYLVGAWKMELISGGHEVR